MIKFFRTIRQNLLERNKFTSYLLYAIGEIILVVIGILIALQVNNLNEKYKLNNLKNVQLEYLESDLRADVIHLESELIGIKEALIDLEKLRERLISPTATKDTLADIINYEYQGRIALYDKKFNNTTYTSLVQTGNIGLFSDQLIKDLSDLNNLQNRTINDANDHWNIYLEKVQNFTSSFAPKRSNNVINEGPLADYLREKSDLKELIIGFNKVFMAKKLTYIQNISFIESTLRTTNRLLDTHFTGN